VANRPNGNALGSRKAAQWLCWSTHHRKVSLGAGCAPQQWQPTGHYGRCRAHVPEPGAGAWGNGAGGCIIQAESRHGSASPNTAPAPQSATGTDRVPSSPWLLPGKRTEPQRHGCPLWHWNSRGASRLVANGAARSAAGQKITNIVFFAAARSAAGKIILNT